MARSAGTRGGGAQNAPETPQEAGKPAEPVVEPEASEGAVAPSEAAAEHPEEPAPIEVLPETLEGHPLPEKGDLNLPHPFAAPRELMPIVEAVRKENPRVFARVLPDGRVAEIITEIQNIEEEWHPDVLKTFKEITDAPEDERPEPGWTHEKGKFKKPEPFKPSSAQLRRKAMVLDGVKVSRQGGKVSQVSLTPELWQRMSDIAKHASMFQELPGGPSVTLPGDPPMEFSSAEDFLSTYRALSGWRERWNQHVDGHVDTPPSNDVTV